jgi:hypothetical protein
MAFLVHKIKVVIIVMYYANQGSYKKEPDWQSKADVRLEKWLKDKKKREQLKRVMDKRLAENK